VSAATRPTPAQAETPTLDATEVRARVLADVTAEREALAVGLAQARADLSALVAEADRLRAEHAAACYEARALHARMPPAPDVPDSSEAQELVHRLMGEGPALVDRERHTLAAARADVEAAWSDARPHLDAEAADLLAAVEALAARYAAWWGLVRDVRHAAETADANARTTNGPSTRMGQQPDALAVLAAGRGADLCAVTPLPGTVFRQPEVIAVQVQYPSGTGDLLNERRTPGVRVPR